MARNSRQERAVRNASKLAKAGMRKRQVFFDGRLTVSIDHHGNVVVMTPVLGLGQSIKPLCQELAEEGRLGTSASATNTVIIFKPA